MQRCRMESYGQCGLTRSGRVVGSREGDSSSNAVGLVAVASANPGGSGHCKWPSVVSGRATRGRRKAEHGGVGTPHSHGAPGLVLGSGAGEVGTFSWRSRARRLVGSLTGPVGDDDELHYKNLPMLCLWQALASTQKTKENQAPAQWERPRNRSHVAVRDRTTKPSWVSDAQAGLIRIPASLPQEAILKSIVQKETDLRRGCACCLPGASAEREFPVSRCGKAAQPRSLEKNAASRAGQTPCARWAVGICYTRALKSETPENRAFEEKARLDVNERRLRSMVR